MKVEVSIGEAIDKLSILELKMKKITDETKKIEIQKEINVLQECEQYKTKYDFYYSLLMYVNEKIWDMTDVIKSITVDDSLFSHISNQIFEFNQKRFRIKNWFNLLSQSNIKEQKSYSSTHCKIIVDSEEDVFFDKLAEINYLSIQYDVLTFESPIISTIKDFLKIPTIIYDEEQIKQLNIPTIICLTDFFIPTSESTEVFYLKPIIYINGALLGDFIQSLSVICEKFYETGRKGILYISNIGDTFRNGLENTYNDIYPVIIRQKYIQEFKIFSDEPYDINLVNWRYSGLVFNTRWYNIYNTVYNVNWGKHKWMEIQYDDKWKDKVIINTTNYRFPNIDFKLLNELHSNNLMYISSDKDAYIYFVNKTLLNIEYYQVNDFLELVTIINSCKLFVGSLSMPFAVANALHKPRILGFANNTTENLDKNWDNIHNLDLDKFLPNVRFNV